MKLKTLSLIEAHMKNGDISINEDMSISINLSMSEKRDIVLSETGVSSKKTRIVDKKLKQIFFRMVNVSVSEYLDA